MESVPGAVATGSRADNKIELARESYPVATAPGTDLIINLGPILVHLCFTEALQRD